VKLGPQIVSPVKRKTGQRPGIARVKSAKPIGVRSGKWLTLRQAQALPNAPDIAPAKGLRNRAVIAVLLGWALRRRAVAALTDGRCSSGFTPEATVAARRAIAPELSRCGVPPRIVFCRDD